MFGGAARYVGACDVMCAGTVCENGAHHSSPRYAPARGRLLLAPRSRVAPPCGVPRSGALVEARVGEGSTRGSIDIHIAIVSVVVENILLKEVQSQKLIEQCLGIGDGHDHIATVTKMIAGVYI